MDDLREEELLRASAMESARSILLARQRAEEELLRAKEFHAAVMDSMGEGLYAIDARGVATYMNPAAERLLGWTSAELVGRRMHDVIHGKLPDGSPLPLEECTCLGALRNGTGVKEFDGVFIRKDGSFLSVTYTASPMHAGAKIVGAVVIFRDARDRHRAEEAQANLAAVVECSDDAIVTKDLNGTIRSWNKGAQRIFGYPPDEVVGGPITVIVPPDRLGEEADILQRLRRGERVDHFDTVRRHKSGALLDISVTISPVRDSSGRIVGASKIARNISARKRAERTAQFLAAANAALGDLTDSEITLRKVAELAVPAFADWCIVHRMEEDGSLRRPTIVHADPARVEAAQALWNRFPPERSDPFGVMNAVRNRKTDWQSEIADALLAQAIRDPERLERVRQMGLRSSICVPLETRTRVIGALTFATAESGRSYTLDDVRTAEDLAHRIVIAIDNANLLKALRDSDRRKDEFLAMLAHELRNPLAPIRNAVEIMRSQETSARDLQWARDVIDRQVGQMTRLIDDLLDVSRITRGMIELRLEKVELASAVTMAIEATRPLMKVRRHELSVVLPSQPLYLDADPTRLAQILSNLLNNAAKYTEEGGHIWLKGERVGSQIEIRVKDTGVGIAREMLPRIFDLFTQGDHSLERSQGGLGIGLTLVQRLVALHGGTVEATSAGPGAGSEFVVRLPAAETAAGSSRQDAEDANVPGTFSARRILVVDDNQDAANGLARLFRMLGHDVQTAYDGLEALGAATTFQPDVAILDIGLPKLNGYDLARRIRAQRKDVVLIAVTGWGQENDRRRSSQAGFDYHVTKPVEFAALKQLLSSLPLSKGVELHHEIPGSN